MNYASLTLVMIFFATSTGAMEADSSHKHKLATHQKVTPYQYEMPHYEEFNPEKLAPQFPVDPAIPKLIQANLRIIPGWEKGNEFEWLPGYVIRECGTAYLLGAAYIRKCAARLD